MRPALATQRDEWQPRSDSRLLVGAQEGDDLADGWLVGQHAGVALVRVQAQAAVGDALGRLPEQLGRVVPVSAQYTPVDSIPTTVTPKLASQSPSSTNPRWWPGTSWSRPAPALLARHPHRRGDRCLVRIQPGTALNQPLHRLPPPRSTLTAPPGGS